MRDEWTLGSDRSKGRAHLAFCAPRDSGYTLVEAVLAIAIAGVAILSILSAVSNNLAGVNLLRSYDERISLAQRVVEEMEAATALAGVVPDEYTSMAAPEAFDDAAHYSYQVWIDDVRVDGGEVIADLKRVRVAVFRTTEGLGSAVSLSTILRVNPWLDTPPDD